MSKSKGGSDIRKVFGNASKTRKREGDGEREDAEDMERRMNNVVKEEREQCGLGTDTSQRKTKSLRFSYNGTNNNVTCDTSMTIQEALESNASFQEISENNQQKQYIIERRVTEASTVTPDFPVCLINENEILDIKFKPVTGTSTQKKTPFDAALMAECENFVSFYISTTGGPGIKYILQHPRLIETSHVCVYARKGEIVEAALRRDGRFKENVFQKGILYKDSLKTNFHLSQPVDTKLDGMTCQIIVNPNQKKKQKSTQKDKKQKAPNTFQPLSLSQVSTSTEEKKTELKEKESRKNTEAKEIPNTQEILKLLREQYKDLLQTLKERENLKNDSEVQRFFRVEYDKSVQSFSEVKKVKKLVELSESVCLICVNGFANGTGFLLFKRFVLTNAHVVKEYDEITQKLQHSLTAVLGFEDAGSPVKEIRVKENYVALLHGKDGMGNYLDFALLELESDVEEEEKQEEEEEEEDDDLPELLNSWTNITPPICGGVCIIGHPSCGVKKMDPCFIIEKDHIPNAAVEHKNKNKKKIKKLNALHALHVMTQKCLNEDRELRASQITYDSCFFQGSSGSPVFDGFCNLIGVHTGGYAYEGVNGETRSVMEYALPLFPILVQIFVQCSKREQEGGRPDVVQYFYKSEVKMKHVIQYAKDMTENKP